jgi:hypothetical protein
MAATVFDFIAAELEARSGFETLQARGTIRLALKAGGLNPQHVTKDQMTAVLENLLPGELTSRGVCDAPALCSALADALKRAEIESPGSDETAPEEVFRRLAGR